MDRELLDYKIFAELFVFPQKKDFINKVKEAQFYLNEKLPNVGELLLPFTEIMCKVSKDEREDIYLRTFEIQAFTTLDIGYVVFGDDYKRGELLVNLNKEFQKYGIDCGEELADNLSNILKLINVIDDKVLLNDLVSKIVAVALSKMIEGFGDDQITAKENIYLKHHKTLLDKHEFSAIYKHAFFALYKALEQDFHFKIQEEPQRSGGFLSSIKQEITLET